MDKSEAGKLGQAKAREKLRALDDARLLTAQAKYEAENKHCPQCGTRISFEKRENTYCNSSCKAKQLNVTRKTKNAREIRLCSCGNKPSGYNLYCDPCIDVGRNHDFHRVMSSIGAKSDKARRAYLLRTRPHQCQYPGCGITTWLGQPVPLEMDHTDGDSDNNTEENLRLLCPNCHALTPTHKGKNKNRGKVSSRQATRNQRYADGLTY